MAASDVSIRYSTSRKAEPLTEREEGQLRSLTAKPRRTPAEQYALGGLRARARSSPEGRRVLENIGAERDAGRPPPVTRRQVSSAVAKAVADAVAARFAEDDL